MGVKDISKIFQILGGFFFGLFLLFFFHSVPNMGMGTLILVCERPEKLHTPALLAWSSSYFVSLRAIKLGECSPF